MEIQLTKEKSLPQRLVARILTAGVELCGKGHEVSFNTIFMIITN